MISRKEILKLSGAGALALAAARAQAAMAGAAPMGPAIPRTGDDLSRLSTVQLRALPVLKPAGEIERSHQRRTFTLVLAPAMTQPLLGHDVQVDTINGISPGPVLRMTEGDDVEITVVNRLSQGSTIHWHGVPVPFAMDGVGMISQDPIAAGAQFTYRWVAPQAGTYMYHAHYNDLEQSSIIGMIVVAPRQASREPRYDVDVPLVITAVDWEPARAIEAQAVLANSMLMPAMAANPKADPRPGMGDAMDRMDMVEYWCLNGKTFPATDPIRVKQGDLVRVRFANITNMIHPMHLHGHWFRVIARDGAPLASPEIANTTPVQPGRTVDIDFVANNPGVWPLHCHIISHMVDNHDVMAGLMTVVVYDGFSLPVMMRS
jgi:FtsP/CotA-like multicopper oxidase with cupredoxin domain